MKRLAPWICLSILATTAAVTTAQTGDGTSTSSSRENSAVSGERPPNLLYFKLQEIESRTAALEAKIPSLKEEFDKGRKALQRLDAVATHVHEHKQVWVGPFGRTLGDIAKIYAQYKEDFEDTGRSFHGASYNFLHENQVLVKCIHGNYCPKLFEYMKERSPWVNETDVRKAVDYPDVTSKPRQPGSLSPW